MPQTPDSNYSLTAFGFLLFGIILSMNLIVCFLVLMPFTDFVLLNCIKLTYDRGNSGLVPILRETILPLSKLFAVGFLGSLFIF